MVEDAQMYLKGADHLLLGAARHFGGAVGLLQKGDQLGGRRAVPDGRGHDLGHEAMVMRQVCHLHAKPSLVLI